MIILLYIVVLIGCAIGGLQFLQSLAMAESAPQQAAGAAMALGWAILPYVFVRAIDRMVASWRQQSMLLELRALRAELKPPALPGRHEPPPAVDRTSGSSALESRFFHLGVAGESHRNEDGSSRQEILKRVQPGEKIRLVPAPDNPFDHLAVEVRRQNGEQIGYLPAGHGLTAPITAGNVDAHVAEVTGGKGHKRHRGCVLLITRRDV